VAHAQREENSCSLVPSLKGRNNSCGQTISSKTTAVGTQFPRGVTTLVARPWGAKLLLLGPKSQGKEKRSQGKGKRSQGKEKRSQGKGKRSQGKEKRSQEKKKLSYLIELEVEAQGEQDILSVLHLQFTIQ
jgi:hypothetical protein